MKLLSVTIEGMHNVVDRKTYTFSDINYIVGHNAVGKTTILNAIQLALLGYIPGTDKKKSAIIKHANSKQMSVSVKLDVDGTPVDIHRTWIRSGANILTSTDISPDNYDISKLTEDIELPIFNFSEFIGMTSNKLKDWFIRFLPNTAVTIDWEDELRKSIATGSTSIDMDEDLLSSVLDAVTRCPESGADAIPWVNDYLKQALTFTRSELSRVADTIKSLVFYEDVDTTVTEVELDNKLKDLQAKQSKQDTLKASIESNNRINEQLLRYRNLVSDTVDSDPNYIKLIEEQNMLKDKFDDTGIAEREAQLESISSQKLKLRTDMYAKQSVIDGNGVCPYTTDRCAQIADLITAYKSEVSAIQANLDDLTAKEKVLKSEIIDIRQHIQVSKLRSAELTNNADMLVRSYAHRDRLRSMIVDIPEDYVVQDYHSDILRIIDLKAKYLANKKYESTMKQLLSDRFKFENQIELYKLWINLTSVNGLQTKVLSESNPFDMLCERMNPYISHVFSNASVEFNVSSKSNSFGFGLIRAGEYVDYELLSSGEKCIVSLALMLSIASMSQGIKLVLVDDALDHLDTTNLDRLFEMLKTNSDVQVLVAGVNVPQVTEGVNMIELV